MLTKICLPILGKYINLTRPLLFVLAAPRSLMNVFICDTLANCLGWDSLQFINNSNNNNTTTTSNNNNNKYIVLVARISLTLSRHFSLSFIASGRSSGLHPVSSHSCWMYVRAGRPAFVRPYVGVHKSTSLMSWSLLLQQCLAWMVRLTWIVFVIGGRWQVAVQLVSCGVLLLGLVQGCSQIIYFFRVFHISVSWWFFTGVWVTASLLKSPELVSGFWPSLAMLSFGYSLPVRKLPSPPSLLKIL